MPKHGGTSQWELGINKGGDVACGNRPAGEAVPPDALGDEIAEFNKRLVAKD